MSLRPLGHFQRHLCNASRCQDRSFPHSTQLRLLAEGRKGSHRSRTSTRQVSLFWGPTPHLLKGLKANFVLKMGKEDCSLEGSSISLRRKAVALSSKAAGWSSSTPMIAQTMITSEAKQMSCLEIEQASVNIEEAIRARPAGGISCWDSATQMPTPASQSQR